MVSRISGIRNKSGVRATEFNFGNRKISISFLKGESLGRKIYGEKYKTLPFNKTYGGLPMILNLTEVLGGAGHLIVISDNRKKVCEYIVGINGDLLKRWREEEEETDRTILARSGDSFFSKVFPEIEPVLNFLKGKVPRLHTMRVFTSSLD